MMMNKLLTELRRRNIFRIAGVYAVVGWVLMQVSGVLENALGLPSWFDTLVVSLLLIGFPVAMLLAWAFEMTPEGVKRTEAVDEEDSVTTKTGRKLDITIVIGLALLVVLVGWQSLNQNKQTPKVNIAMDVTSIAVLPFVDLSPNGDQEYFADGVSEEILNVLVPIEGLKVAGRTSSFSFKGRNEDLREIGAALDVNHVLEGSVRRSGTKLRITAQLIRSEDGFHIWSETYDRELTDIFEIQDEIARAVAEQLADSLGLSFGLPSETLVKDRTKDIVAYELYLRAKQLHEKRGKDNLDTALLLLSETTARDPGFAPAWTQLANVYSVYQAYQTKIPNEATVQHWRAIGKAAARRAIKLSPDNGAAHASLASMYAYDFNWINSFEEYDKALALAPDNANIRDTVAQNLIEVGKYEQAIEMSLRAIEIDPLVAIYRNSLGIAYNLNGEYEKAMKQFRRGQELDPSLPFTYYNIWDMYISQGRTQDALSLVEEAFADGLFKQGDLDLTKTIHTAFNAGDEQAKRALIESVDDYYVRFLLTGNLGDKRVAIEALDLFWKHAVERGNTYTIFMLSKLGPVYDQPRFKEEVRKNNILAYWQQTSFPPYCHAVGTDDFSCE
jgi:TolB-like protein/tetratricopeptide (TPR) repeat protein